MNKKIRIFFSRLVIAGQLIQLMSPAIALAADNMCNVNPGSCTTDQQWIEGWGAARQEENAGAVAKQDEWTNANDSAPEIIREAGESNDVNRSQKAADAGHAPPVNAAVSEREDKYKKEQKIELRQENAVTRAEERRQRQEERRQDKAAPAPAVVPVPVPAVEKLSDIYCNYCGGFWADPKGAGCQDQAKSKCPDESGLKPAVVGAQCLNANGTPCGKNGYGTVDIDDNRDGASDRTEVLTSTAAPPPGQKCSDGKDPIAGRCFDPLPQQPEAKAEAPAAALGGAEMRLEAEEAAFLREGREGLEGKEGQGGIIKVEPKLVPPMPTQRLKDDTAFPTAAPTAGRRLESCRPGIGRNPDGGCADPESNIKIETETMRVGGGKFGQEVTVTTKTFCSGDGDSVVTQTRRSDGVESSSSTACDWGCAGGSCRGPTPEEAQVYRYSALQNAIEREQIACKNTAGDARGATGCTEAAVYDKAINNLQAGESSPIQVEIFNQAGRSDTVRQAISDKKYDELADQAILTRAAASETGEVVPLTEEQKAGLKKQADAYAEEVVNTGSLSAAGYNTLDADSQVWDKIANVSAEEAQRLVDQQGWLGGAIANNLFCAVNNNYRVSGECGVQAQNMPPMSDEAAEAARGYWSFLVAGKSEQTLWDQGMIFGDPRSAGFQAREYEDKVAPACGVQSWQRNLTDEEKACLTGQSVAAKARIAEVDEQNAQMAALNIGSVALGFGGGAAAAGIKGAGLAAQAGRVAVGSGALSDAVIAVGMAEAMTAGDRAASKAVSAMSRAEGISETERQTWSDQAEELTVQADEAYKQNALYGVLFAAVGNVAGEVGMPVIGKAGREALGETPVGKLLFGSPRVATGAITEAAEDLANITPFWDRQRKLWVSTGKAAPAREVLSGDLWTNEAAVFEVHADGGLGKVPTTVDRVLAGIDNGSVQEGSLVAVVDRDGNPRLFRYGGDGNLTEWSPVGAGAGVPAGAVAGTVPELAGSRVVTADEVAVAAGNVWAALAGDTPAVLGSGEQMVIIGGNRGQLFPAEQDVAKLADAIPVGRDTLFGKAVQTANNLAEVPTAVGRQVNEAVGGATAGIKGAGLAAQAEKLSETITKPLENNPELLSTVGPFVETTKDMLKRKPDVIVLPGDSAVRYEEAIRSIAKANGTDEVPPIIAFPTGNQWISMETEIDGQIVSVGYVMPGPNALAYKDLSDFTVGSRSGIDGVFNTADRVVKNRLRATPNDEQLLAIQDILRSAREDYNRRPTGFLPKPWEPSTELRLTLLELFYPEKMVALANARSVAFFDDVALTGHKLCCYEDLFDKNIDRSIERYVVIAENKARIPEGTHVGTTQDVVGYPFLREYVEDETSTSIRQVKLHNKAFDYESLFAEAASPEERNRLREAFFATANEFTDGKPVLPSQRHVQSYAQFLQEKVKPPAGIAWVSNAVEGVAEKVSSTFADSVTDAVGGATAGIKNAVDNTTKVVGEAVENVGEAIPIGRVDRVRTGVEGEVDIEPGFFPSEIFTQAGAINVTEPGKLARTINFDGSNTAELDDLVVATVVDNIDGVPYMKNPDGTWSVLNEGIGGGGGGGIFDDVVNLFHKNPPQYDPAKSRGKFQELGVSIGRLNENRARNFAQINPNDATMSREHAVLFVDRGRLVLRDTSKYGTTVNGLRINSASQIYDGDRIVLGYTPIEVRVDQSGRVSLMLLDPDARGKSFEIGLFVEPRRRPVPVSKPQSQVPPPVERPLGARNSTQDRNLLTVASMRNNNFTQEEIKNWAESRGITNWEELYRQASSVEAQKQALKGIKFLPEVEVGGHIVHIADTVYSQSGRSYTPVIIDGHFELVYLSQSRGVFTQLEAATPSHDTAIWHIKSEIESLTDVPPEIDHYLKGVTPGLNNRAVLGVEIITPKLADQELIIGRAANANIRVPDEADSVSRRHAGITVSNGRVEIEDLGSTNGTFINGVRVSLGEGILVRPGDTVRLGPEYNLLFDGERFLNLAEPGSGKSPISVFKFKTDDGITVLKQEMGGGGQVRRSGILPTPGLPIGNQSLGFVSPVTRFISQAVDNFAARFGRGSSLDDLVGPAAMVKSETALADVVSSNEVKAVIENLPGKSMADKTAAYLAENPVRLRFDADGNLTPVDDFELAKLKEASRWGLSSNEVGVEVFGRDGVRTTLDRVHDDLTTEAVFQRKQRIGDFLDELSTGSPQSTQKPSYVSAAKNIDWDPNKFSGGGEPLTPQNVLAENSGRQFGYVSFVINGDLNTYSVMRIGDESLIGKSLNEEALGVIKAAKEGDIVAVHADITEAPIDEVKFYKVVEKDGERLLQPVEAPEELGKPARPRGEAGGEEKVLAAGRGGAENELPEESDVQKQADNQYQGVSDGRLDIDVFEIDSADLSVHFNLLRNKIAQSNDGRSLRAFDPFSDEGTIKRTPSQPAAKLISNSEITERKVGMFSNAIIGNYAESTLTAEVCAAGEVSTAGGDGALAGGGFAEAVDERRQDYQGDSQSQNGHSQINDSQLIHDIFFATQTARNQKVAAAVKPNNNNTGSTILSRIGGRTIEPKPITPISTQMLTTVWNWADVNRGRWGTTTNSNFAIEEDSNTVDNWLSMLAPQVYAAEPQKYTYFGSWSTSTQPKSVTSGFGRTSEFLQSKNSGPSERGLRIMPLAMYRAMAGQVLLRKAVEGLAENERTAEKIGEAALGAAAVANSIPKTGALSSNEAGYWAVSGTGGIAAGGVAKGIYRVTADAVGGLDLTVPEKVNVGVNGDGAVMVGVTEGRGRVKIVGGLEWWEKPMLRLGEWIERRLAPPARAAAPKESSADPSGFGRTSVPMSIGMGPSEKPAATIPLTVQLFIDENKNGKMDSGEEPAKLAGVKVNLAAETKTVSYKLTEGWNLVAFPLIPESVKTAAQLIQDAALDGGYVTTVATWEQDKWMEFSQRGGQKFGQDFELQPGRAYFLNSHSESAWTLAGTPLPAENRALQLRKGWNGVGLPVDAGTAVQFMDDLQIRGEVSETSLREVSETTETADQAARWDFGLWDVVVKRRYSPEHHEIYGRDFPIKNTEGYFIHLNEEVDWFP